MKITKEQWAAIENELEGFFCNVAFSLEGYEVTVSRVQEKEGKTCLAVYIDDLIKGKWIMKDGGSKPNILDKVWKARTKSLYAPSKVKKFEKQFGKRRARKEYPELYHKQHWLEPYFPKASVLCRQFKKIEGLTLVKARCLEEDHG